MFFVMACGDDGSGDGGCLDPLPLPPDCNVQFNPTWEDFYGNVVESSCGNPGTGPNCHSAEGQMAGLDLSAPDLAYDELIGVGGDDPRVIPGDPECSELVRRIESDDPAVQMPPLSPLNAAQRCAIRQWIAEGAKPE